MNEETRFHPDPESLSVIELPLSVGFLDRLNRDRTWRFTGILLGACIVCAGAIFGLTGDTWVIFEMIEAVFFGALALFPAGIVLGICAGLGSLHLQKARELIQSEFLAAVAEAHDSQPGFLHAFVPDQKFARLYAFDNRHRALFLMRPHRHKKSWHILRLPLSLVRRCELITATDTKTRGQASGNEITFTTETNSQYSVRLHYLTEAGEPGIDMLHFDKDEALAQKWLTALGG